MLESSFGASHLVDSSGTPIHCVERGSGPLMVLIHGYPDFWYTWRAQLPEFAGSFRTIAMDLRGFNRSGKPVGVDEYRIPKLCCDVRAVVEHTGAPQGRRPLSWGTTGAEYWPGIAPC
jgi:pimeloyl-ACP methyl ester carboxylesterase